MRLPHRTALLLALLFAPAALAAPPDADEARIAGAIELLQQRKADQAKPILAAVVADLRAQLEKAKADAPAAARCQFLLARALFNLEQDADAVAAIDQAVALAPAAAAYHHERAQILGQLGKHADAVQAHLKATELEPKNPDYWLALAYRYADLSAHDEAEKTFEKSIAINPNEPRLLGALAGHYATLGKPERALPLLEKAIALDPKYANAWRNLGQIHQSAGRPAESNKAYTALLKLTPDDPSAWSKLVQNYTALGDAKARDAARAKLFELHKAGKTPQPFFCREQFKAHLLPVMVFEYYELTGERALRYSFRVLDEAGRVTQRTLSLGSYESTTQMARESGQIPKDARVFHLDLYEQDGHSTFAMYTKEPTYDQVRAAVASILDGKMQPLSSSKTEPEMKEDK